MIIFYKNNTYYLETSIIDNNGDFVTTISSGETVSYALRRSSDGVLIASGDMVLDGNIWKAQYTFTAIGEYRIEYTTPDGYENGMEEILVEEVSLADLEIKIDAIITTLSTLVSNIWNYGTRTLTSFGTLVSSIWSNITRTLTSGTKDTEIDAIKTKTDNLPTDPTSETNATTNKGEIITDIGNIETLIKRILGLTQENFRIFSPSYDANNNLLSATIKIYPTKADCNANTNVLATYSMVATYSGGKMATYKVTKE